MQEQKCVFIYLYFSSIFSHTTYRNGKTCQLVAQLVLTEMSQQILGGAMNFCTNMNH